MCIRDRQCGYKTEYKVLNAADYGVLQNRKRVILIGKYGDEENFYPAIEKKERKYTVGEIFRDLPELQAGAGSARPVQTLDYQGTYLYEAGIKSRNNQMITFHNACLLYTSRCV